MSENNNTAIQPASEEPKTDTIETQQVKKQKTTLVNNEIVEKGEKQKTKGCFKKSKEISEVKKMADLLTISSCGGMAISALAFTNSMVDIIDGEKNISSHLNAFLSLGGFCENCICFIHAVIGLSKFKQNNKEVQTETAPKGKNLSRVLQNVIGRLDKVFSKSKDSEERD